jgi:murein DD-endopeptidase MepM/ murein hydrolase activator NlpD
LQENAIKVYNLYVKKLLPTILIIFAFIWVPKTLAAIPAIVVAPEIVQQGEPLMITIDGVNATSSIVSLTFGTRPLGVFLYKSKVTALVGIDLNKKPGTTTITAVLDNGLSLTKDVYILERKKYQAPLGIPEKLGGNTPAAEQNLVSTLSIENGILDRLRTGKKAFWTEPFRFPLINPIVTDPYGYIRKTGASTITHRGTDFHADQGTPVMAMNRGVVRLARRFQIYGNTIVVDHGLGLMTFYMHLSEIDVNEGQLVQKGEIIGASGETGYAEMPHLHISVRMNTSSIDPIRFMEFFR